MVISPPFRLASCHATSCRTTADTSVVKLPDSTFLLNPLCQTVRVTWISSLPRPQESRLTCTLPPGTHAAFGDLSSWSLSRGHCLLLSTVNPRKSPQVSRRAESVLRFNLPNTWTSQVDMLLKPVSVWRISVPNR